MHFLYSLRLKQRGFIYNYGVKSDTTRDFFHAHEGMEFLYVHQGQGLVMINNRVYTIGPGSLMYFQPFQMHRIHITSDEQHPYIRTLIVADPDEWERSLTVFPRLHQFFTELWKNECKEQVLTGMDQNAYLQALLKQIDNQLSSSHTEERKERFYAEMTSFLQVIRESWHQDNRRIGVAARGQHHVEHIMAWVEANYKEPYRLDRLAADLHMSGYHLSHLFREVMGTTITEYITARRMKEACFLLHASSSPVQRIGEEVGFPNFSYFCQAFKKKMGVTPHQYRIQTYELK
ncbi:AraC family transcriptional regulator [Paenibacillus oryzisoli]|uniref:AraC family transcriptional regulator n=1 Tax=Paenibacillus oryzisoli TaxID=1850517 RepID=UPI003D29A874